MVFDHPNQADLYAKVEQYLQREYGELVDVVEDEPAFFVTLRRSNFLVTVSANGAATAVMVYATLGDGLAVTPEVARFLLRRNHDQMPFGAIGLQEDERIAVHHVLLGETVTDKTLLELLETLAESCEQLEDDIDAHFRSNPPRPRPAA